MPILLLMLKLKLLFRDQGGDTDESFSSLPLQRCRKLLVADGWAPEAEGEQWEAAGEAGF